MPERKNDKFYNKATKRYIKISKGNISKYNKSPNNFLLPKNITKTSYIKSGNKLVRRESKAGKKASQDYRQRFKSITRRGLIKAKATYKIQDKYTNTFSTDLGAFIKDINYTFNVIPSVSLETQLRMFYSMNKLGRKNIPIGANAQYQIYLSNNLFRNQAQVLNTKRYNTFDGALGEMIYKLQSEDDYQDWDFDEFNEIIIRVSYASDSNGVMGTGSLCIDLDNDEWFCYDKLSRTNCFWNSVFIARRPQELIDIIIHGNNNNISKRGASIKNRFSNNCKKIGIHFNGNVSFDIVKDGQNFVDVMDKSKHKLEIDIYDENYNLILELRAEKHNPKHKHKRISLRKVGGHICPMFRYKQLEDLKIDIKSMKKDIKGQLMEHLNSKLITRGRKRPCYDNTELHKISKDEATKIIREKYGIIKGNEKERIKLATSIYKKNGGKISMTNKDGEHDMKIATLDIEATNNDTQLQDYKHGVRWYKTSGYSNEINTGVFKSYVVGVGWFDEDFNTKYEVFEDTSYNSNDSRSCIVKFLEWLNTNAKTFEDYKIYAHNGGRFDWNLFLSEGLSNNPYWRIEAEKVIELNGCYINIPLKNKINGIKLELRDSYRILSEKLDDLTQEYDVEHKKLTGEIDFKTITFNNWHQQRTDVLRYLYNDVVGLLEVLTVFSEEVYNNFDGINITQQFTSATLAKSYWFLNEYDSNKYPIFNLSKEVDDYITPSYYGGRCECFALGDVSKAMKPNGIYYMDFTSLYPSVMEHNELPFGQPTFYNFDGLMNKDKINKIKLFERNRWCIVRCMVKSINFKKKPIHAMKDDVGRLVFRYYDTPTEMTLNGQELLLGLKNNMYEYEILDAYVFYKAKYFKKAVKMLFERKAKAKREGNSCLAKICKIVVNSLYGFWCFNRYDRQGVRFYEKDDFNRLLKDFQDNKILEWKELGEYLVARINDDVNMDTCNKAIGSAITSLARMRLWELMNDIEDRGGTIYYCDTDSVMTDYNLFNDWYLRQKYQWDRDGSELGSLKNECDDEIIDFFRDYWAKKFYNKKFKVLNEDKKIDIKKKAKKTAERQREIDGPTGHYKFDTLIIGACKMYHIGKTLFNGEYIEINKMKGWKKHGKKGHNYDMTLLDVGTEKHEYTGENASKQNWNEEGLSKKVFNHLTVGGSVVQAGEQWLTKSLVNGFTDKNKDKMKGKENKEHEDFNILIKYQLRQFRSIYTKGIKEKVGENFYKITPIIV